MAVGVFFYDVGQEAIMDASINLVTDTIRAMLVDSTSNAQTRDKSTIANVGNITNINAASRITLTGLSVADTASGNITKWDSTLDVVFTSVSGGPILGCVIYKFVTNDAGSTPICYLDGSIFPITTTGDDITVKFNASGIGQATAQFG